MGVPEANGAPIRHRLAGSGQGIPKGFAAMLPWKIVTKTLTEARKTRGVSILEYPRGKTGGWLENHPLPVLPLVHLRSPATMNSANLKIAGLTATAIALLPLLGIFPGRSTAATMDATMPLAATPSLDSPAIAQDRMPETVLFFETENFAVRVFRRGQPLFMNLFDKRTGITVVRDTPAELIPQPDGWISYRTTMGEMTRYAWLSGAGDTRLEIRNPSDDSIFIQENGFDAVVGVSNGQTGFQGNNFAPGTSAKVTAPRYAELRRKPSPTAEVVTTVPRGDRVDVLDRVGSLEDGFIWYQVSYNGTRGWIRSDTLMPI